jgi:phage shock protein C
MDTKETHKKLYRLQKNRVIAGVCSGLGKYFVIDPVIVRIVFALLALGHGFGILLYLILLFVIPKEPQEGETEPTKPSIESSAQEIKEIAQEIGEKAKSVMQDMRKDEPRKSRKNIIGWIIVVFGIIILINQLFPFSWMRWDLSWPIILILAGAYLIFRK